MTKHESASGRDSTPLVSIEQSLLTQRETSRVLHISQRTLQKWRSEGRGPRWLRVGRRIWYRPADIEEWLDEQVVDPR